MKDSGPGFCPTCFLVIKPYSPKEMMSTKEGRHFTSAPEEYSAPPLPDDRKALNDLTKLIPYLFCTFYSI